MATSETGRVDAPACPYLGLAADPRTRFTFPHPGHRCFAAGHAASADARRQTTFCLSLEYPSCDRYQAAGPAPGREAVREPSTGTTFVHVFRAGDSLAGIARRYNVTVEQIAIDNRIGVTDVLPDGTRLVIPLRRPDANMTPDAKRAGGLRRPG
jgi:hypothetical protein